MDRWQYWTYAGQLAEWRDDFESCIALHQQAADVPGLPARWKSASLINLGIALRKRGLGLIALARARGEPPGAEALRDLVGSYAATARGARMKLGLGDMDEAATGLHNASYTMLHLAVVEKSGTYSGIKAAQLALRGIEILKGTNSTKKLGLLLVECAFGLMLAGGGAAPANAVTIAPLMKELSDLDAARLIPASDIADILSLHNDLFAMKAARLADIVTMQAFERVSFAA